MARPIKSKNMKKVQGTYRPGQDVISLNLHPLKELPDAPTEFNENEKWFYNTTCQALFSAGLLRNADLMTIRSMAGWWSIMTESQKDIRDNGMIQRASTGWQSVSPSVLMFEKAWNKLKDFSDRYGFNLVSKDKITAPEKSDAKADKLRQMAG